MKSRILMSILVIVVSISMMASVTLAWFTDEATSTNNTFTAGTLKLKVNEVDESNTFEIANITLENMQPGDKMEEDAVITIENSGSLDLGWVGKFIMSGNSTMQNYVYIDYMKMEFIDPEGRPWEATDEFIKNGVGAGDYAENINIAIDSDLGVITLKKWIETNGAGNMPGSGYQNMGALKPGYKYRLTFRLGLHHETPNAAQGKSVNIGYHIEAAQLKTGAITELYNDLTWFNAQIDKQK